ncbi:MAG: hypothetical protein H6993_10090 [Pseudomonadales bacterium]|nr:hypothetical protein [Pseudomonadales bacterium]
MNKPSVARNAIGPLLDQLIYQLRCEGSQTQCAYFTRIRHSLNLAHDDFELLVPIQALSTTTAFGFCFSQDADVLIERILEKAREFGADFDYANGPRH